MGLQARVQREFKFVRALIRTLRRVGSISGQSSHLVCDDIEDAVDSWRERRAITPDIACASTSCPPLCAYGPVRPKPVPIA